MTGDGWYATGGDRCDEEHTRTVSVEGEGGRVWRARVRARVESEGEVEG